MGTPHYNTMIRFDDTFSFTIIIGMYTKLNVTLFDIDTADAGLRFVV